MVESMAKKSAKGPLNGVRVLDMTAVLMGPYCTQILSDLGAEVIKIESPEGDITREIGPGKRAGASGLFATLNRGKRGIELDLKQPEAIEAVLQISKSCHVFIHSTRPAAMARLGLSYDRMRAENPQIIYANLAGFGSQGRYAGQPAYDDVIQGMTGVPVLEAMASGNSPRYLANTMADKVSGLAALYSVLAALYAQKTTGEGQELEISMFETMAGFMLTEHMTGAVFDPPQSAPVYKRLIARERTPFRTKDGWIAATVYNNKQVHRFAELTGREDIKTDPRFANVSARLEHMSEWCNLLQSILETRNTKEWLDILGAGEVPCAPINSTQDLLSDPHLLDVEFFETMHHPQDGKLTFPKTPTKFSKTPVQSRGLPPEKGEHTHDVLREFGVREAVIAKMAEHRRG